MGSDERLNVIIKKWTCCLLNSTVASRIIACLGIVISLFLILTFANGKFWYTETNFDISRKMALALGLDWQHFHGNASMKYEDESKGAMIAIIVAFFSFALLGANLLLLVATLRYDWCFALPWLIIELMSCISKLGALIFHWKCDPYELDAIFFIGSIIFIGVSFWWWLVVFSAQLTWRNKQKFDIETEMFTLHALSQNDLISENYNKPYALHINEESYTDMSDTKKNQNHTIMNYK